MQEEAAEKTGYDLCYNKGTLINTQINIPLDITKIVGKNIQNVSMWLFIQVHYFNCCIRRL
jgi:hypothetical protein